MQVAYWGIYAEIEGTEYVKYGGGYGVMIGNGYEGEALQGLQRTVEVITIEQHSRWKERCLQMNLQRRKVVVCRVRATAMEISMEV